MTTQNHLNQPGDLSESEMLELAAKAMGYWNILGQPCPWVGESWNPLINDGDALRLAVKLRMELDFEGDQVCADVGEFGLREFRRDDPYAAARRAITRAAAEIGRAML